MNTPNNTSSTPPTYLCTDADDESVPMQSRGYLGEGPGIYASDPENEIKGLFDVVQALTQEKFEEMKEEFFQREPREDKFRYSQFITKRTPKELEPWRDLPEIIASTPKTDDQEEV